MKKTFSAVVIAGAVAMLSASPVMAGDSVHDLTPWVDNVKNEAPTQPNGQSDTGNKVEMPFADGNTGTNEGTHYQYQRAFRVNVV